VPVFDEEDLRTMSPHERIRLLHALAEIDGTAPPGGQAAGIASVFRPTERRRQVVLLVIIAGCIGLAIWTGVLAATLPRFYRSGGWRGAWVGFDVALLTALAATGWAAWRRRQVLIICLIVLATLLLCDAWFDVVLDLRTPGFELSLLSAAVLEVPIAALAILGARRLIRLTIGMVDASQGRQVCVLPLWRVPLYSDSAAETFRDLFPHLAGDAPAAGVQRGEVPVADVPRAEMPRAEIPRGDVPRTEPPRLGGTHGDAPRAARDQLRPEDSERAAS
jgi:hypothetical protein